MYYKSASGVTLFINANFTRLEHYSWAVLSDLSGSVSKWQHVVDNLFDGDNGTADILMLKVRAAKIEEAAAQRPEARRLAKAAAKEATLQKKRANDEQGPAPEEPQQPPPPRVDAFAQLMPKAKAPESSESFQDTEVFSVPFPKKGFDVQGSETYKAFRDESAVLEKMIGWQLITDGLGHAPPAVHEAQKMKLESNTKLLPTDPIFSFHSKWRFRLSSIALSSLADAYGKTVTQMRGQSINATHFLKMAAAKKKALRAEEKTKAAEKKVPKAVQARKDWQDESLQKLHNERDIVLQPLQ